MFTFDTLVDTAAKNAKTSLSYVPDTQVRQTLESVIDANVQFAQTVYDINLELSKIFADRLQNNSYTKPLAEAAKKFTAKK